MSTNKSSQNECKQEQSERVQPRAARMSVNKSSQTEWCKQEHSERM
jgi:hypothetical protein